jgi:hypothetical protein
MRPKSLLVLAALVALLGGFIFLVERKQPSPEERARGGKKVFAFEASQVRSLHLERAGKIVRFERDPEIKQTASGEATSRAGWRLREPLDDRADRFAVQSLVDSLAALEKQRDLPDVDPATLGLDRPRAVVTLSTDEGEKTLEIGAELPVGDVMAIAVRGQPGAAIVTSAIFAELTRDVAAWRSPEWSVAEVDRVEGVEVRGLGEPVVLRKVDGEWKLGAEKAGAAEVNDLLYAVSGARADEILERPAAEARGAALAEPDVTVVLKSEQSREETLRSFGALKGGLVPAMVSDREAVLLLPASVLQSIAAKVEAVRKAKAATAAEDGGSKPAAS